MEQRLTAGVWQCIGWSALVVVSLGYLSWVPFLFMGTKRGKRRDWLTMTAFAVAAVGQVVWAASLADAPGNPVLGAFVTVHIVTAVVLVCVWGSIVRWKRSMPSRCSREEISS